MDTYYQLIDRDTSTVTIWWKASHIIYFIIAIISGFTTAYALGRAVDAFGDQCILNASITFLEHIENVTEKPPNNATLLETHTHSLPPINIATTEWGTPDLCYFCQFTPLMCMINAVVWGTFFIICSRGGAGYISDMIYGSWIIVYPALLFTGLATVLMLISSVMLQEGAKTFCAQFEKVFDIKKCTRNIDDYTLFYNDFKVASVVYLLVAVYCSYICFAAWLLQLVTLIVRITCIVDFELIRITVWPRGKEVVQKVINLDGSDTSTLATGVESQPHAFPKLGRHHMPLKSKSSRERARVSFIDESLAKDIKRTASLNSLEQEEMLLAEMHKAGSENTDSSATTSFSDPSSPTAKNKSDATPTLNSILSTKPSKVSTDPQ